MREDIKKTLCDLQDRAAHDIRKLLDGKPDFTPTEWDSAGKAVDIIKDVECSIKDALTASAMEEEYGGESGRNYGRPLTDYYPMGDMSPMYSRRGMRGSYSNGNGGSYRGNSYGGSTENTIANLRNLMNNASSESERMMYQRFIDEAESMR